MVINKLPVNVPAGGRPQETPPTREAVAAPEKTAAATRDDSLNFSVTDEQREYYRDKYDLNNMSDSKTDELLDELVRGGFLTQQDKYNYGTVTVNAYGENGYWVLGSDGTYRPRNNLPIQAYIISEGSMPLRDLIKLTPENIQDTEIARTNQDLIQSYLRIARVLQAIFG